MRIVSQILACFALGLIPILCSSEASAQGTAFTYSGRLWEHGAPANGEYDLSFAAYDNSTGGNLVSGPVTQAPVAVSNGVFSVIVDLGDGTFTGPMIWLEIGVRTNGDTNAYVVLSPRQEVTPAPYAIFSEESGFAAYSSTAVTANSLIDHVVSAAQLNTAAAPVGGQVLSFNGTNLVWTTIPGGGGGGGGGWALTGNAGTIAGVDFLGTTDNQPLILRANGQNALELQYAARTGLPNPSDQFAMNVLGGWWGNVISNGVIGATIAGGGENGRDRSSLQSFSYPNVVSEDFGTVSGGYGNMAGNLAVVPGGALNVASGAFSFAGGFQAVAQHNGCFVWSGALSTPFASTAENQFLIQASGGVGINTNYPHEFLTIAGVTTYNNGMKLTGATAAGTGMALENTSSGGHKYDLISTGGADGPGGGAFGIYDETTGKYGLVLSPAGGVSVNVLTITGGADLAEPFKLAGNAIPKGSVVVIDEDHPGQLKLSTTAYDTRVAGIVSGANGIHPGIALHQDDLMNGDQDVALSGRVYVQADATYGAIKPGDLLTSSATPGHAMKVLDHARAQGAILGKAMSGLNQGQGLVLVLVTLQ